MRVPDMHTLEKACLRTATGCSSNNGVLLCLLKSLLNAVEAWLWRHLSQEGVLLELVHTEKPLCEGVQDQHSVCRRYCKSQTRL